ncbi:hypothetical protein O6H91_04G086000 [Diphasiastrum complanatum]|uniref:Uncharacterized protein n=1 Tax=Diphasiastrum complanatum TaxID=34168 RepID=A0ACC2DZ92_DIPCM|nr:hypothetical protein O6H91_04G086000 [Diphasiastrum complanatum]
MDWREGVAILLLGFISAWPPIVIHAADPDPVSDFVGDGIAESFVLRDIFVNGDVSNTTGGVRAGLGPKFFPAQTNQGVSITRFLIAPCGFNPPQTHPRGTEMLTLLEGGPLEVGFVDTEGQTHINILHPNDVTCFPRGMMHFTHNVGTEVANAVSGFNSQDPGFMLEAVGMFHLPAKVVAGAFNQSQDFVNKINQTMYAFGNHLVRSEVDGCVPGRSSL